MDADLILSGGLDRTDRPRWLKTRQSGIGGSDVSVILGMSKWKTARDIWEEKTGILEPGWDDGANEAAGWGTLLEPVVRDEFARLTGVGVTVTGTYRSRSRPWMLANPDGLTSDGGLYEGKTGSAWKADEWDDGQIPDHAELQVQHNMAVLGLPHAWVAGLIGGQRLEYVRVDRDDELVAMLYQIEEEFWQKVQDKTEPELAGPGSDDYLKRRFPRSVPKKTTKTDAHTWAQLKADYTVAGAAKKVDEGAYTAAQNAIRDLLRDAEALQVGEKVVATWDHTGSRFDEATFAQEYPELAEEFTRPVPQLDVKALLAEHPEMSKYRPRVLRVKR